MLIRKSTAYGYEILSLLLLFIIISSIGYGCREVTPGHRLFTLRKGLGHYSFEYPVEYKRSASDQHSGYSREYFHRLLPEQDPIYARFIILIIEAGRHGDPDARTTLESDISYHSESAKDFRILEQSSLIIAGVDGELLVTSYFPKGQFGGFSEIQIMVRSVYFDYDGSIWEITMISSEEFAETARADFEHLLKTFQILE